MTVSFPGGNLGDALWLTPLARWFSDLTVQLRAGDKRAKAVSELFNGMCKVEFVDNPAETKKTDENIHVTQKILHAHGIWDDDSMPRIKLTQGELDWAKAYLSAYHNPIILINSNSGTNDPLNYRAQYVRPPDRIMQELCSYFMNKNFTVLQFGPDAKYYDRDPYLPLINAVHIRGLTLRQTAACYAIVGKMISGDTGDYHLMLAVGGQCVTLVPHENLQLGYSYSDLLYGFACKCWKDNDKRILYIQHDDYKCIIEEKLWL